jgi:hypothetical protein
MLGCVHASSLSFPDPALEADCGPGYDRPIDPEPLFDAFDGIAAMFRVL